MANTLIQLKKSVIPGNVPSSLAVGELALNAADGKLFYADPTNIIKYISTGTTANSFSTINVNSSLLIATSSSSILSIAGSNSIDVSGDYLNDTITITAKDSSVLQKGVVQLYDGYNSNSTTLAATANSVLAVYDILSSISNSGQLTTNYKTEEFIATANQTSFIVSDGYTPEYISVYINGVLLSSSDYVANDGSSIILSTPAYLDDSIIINKWYFDASMYLSVLQKIEEFTATANQTNFTISGIYEENYIKIYRNGVLLENSAYTANGGSHIILTDGANESDIISIEYWGSSSINASPVYVIANNALEIANNKIDKLDNGYFTSGISNTTTNSSNQVLDSFSLFDYRSVKYQIQVTSGTDYQCSEVMLLQNGTDCFITEYALITTGSTLMTYNCDINSSNARLLMTPLNSTNQIKFVKTAITV